MWVGGVWVGTKRVSGVTFQIWPIAPHLRRVEYTFFMSTDRRGSYGVAVSHAGSLGRVAVFFFFLLKKKRQNPFMKIYWLVVERDRGGRLFSFPRRRLLLRIQG